MEINRIKRPWDAPSQRRYNRDPFYNSTEWKKTKQAFKLGYTELPDGRRVSNTMCLECYKEGIVKAGHSIDHIVRIKDGGSRTDFSNLQNLCEHHHAVKSAYEAQIKS
jgi:5-methylcytosine-specific restriction enzyme A